MSQHDDFDRSVARWLESEARPAATADVLDRALRATRRRRPRPRLYATLQGHWIGDGAASPSEATFWRTGLRTSMALVALLLVLAVMAGLVAVGARLVQPAPVDLGIFAPVAGRIVYGDARGIWGVDPAAPADPATRVQLTPRPGTPLGWSRDGTRLLIMRGGLLVLHADGSEIPVTEGPWRFTGATISPDGSRVVFAGVTEGTGSALYAVDADGGPVETLRGNEGHLIQQPAFSPDGTRIAYAIGGGDNSNNVWLMDADGSDAHPIVPNEWSGHVHGLAWSPAGDHLAFGLGGKIYTFAPDGSDLTEIIGADTSCGPADPCSVKLPKSAESPYWSPDGSRIAYTTGCVEGVGAGSRRGCGLAIADADGSDERKFGFATSGPWHPAPITSDERSPAPTAEPTPTPSPWASRRDGEVIGFGRRATVPGWDLIAQDPATGEVRTIVQTDGIVDCPEVPSCQNFVRRAEWAPDGRSVAFQVSNLSLDGPPLGACSPTVGIWVASASGGPRQLTTPCASTPGSKGVEELWAWSPAGDRLAYARVDGEVDELLVVDASDGAWTSLGTTDGSVSKLAWSPDGTQIAYADGGSVLVIGADGGERSLLANSFVFIIDLAWSPDGSRILVHDQGRYRIQVMNADGSDLHVLLEGSDACCSTEWSPTGDRIVYMLSVVRPGELESGYFDSQVWTVSPDGSDAIEVFDSDGCDMRDPADLGLLPSMGFVGDSLPVWVPGGREVAYNECGTWVVANADGTGGTEALRGARSRSGGPPLLHRSWDGGGLSASDLVLIGQVDR